MAPGTCDIVRRITLANASLSVSTQSRPSTAYDEMRRIAGGFTEEPRTNLVEATVGAAWLRIDADGTQTTHAVESERFFPVNDFINFGPPNRIFHIGADYTEHYVAAFADEGTTKLTLGTPLFEAQPEPDFRFLRHGAAVSFDGQRALLMTAVTSAYGPRLAMIQADASQVGEAVELPQVFDCQNLVPTERGGAFYTSTSSLHWVEFGPGGDVIREVDVPLDIPPSERAGCPLVALTEEGFAVLVRESKQIIRVGPDGARTVEAWDNLVGTLSAFAVKGDTVMAITRNVEGYHVIKQENGKVQYFPIDTGGTQIPSEAGSLFMYVTRSPLASVATREVVEIRCDE